MKVHHFPIAFLLVAGLAGSAHAVIWEGAQYFKKGFQCTIVPEAKKDADEEDGPGAGMQQGHIECFGTKMRMEAKGVGPSARTHGKDMSGDKDGKKSAHARSDEDAARNMIMIMDAAANKAFILVPEKKMYMETDFSQAKGKDRANDLFNRKAELEELGRETIEGHACRKVRPTWIDAKGKKEKSDEILWLASDLHDFPIQSMDGEDGNIVHYRDIKFGPIPNSRFEIPAGFTKGSFGDLMGGSMSAEDKAKMDEAMKGMNEKMNSKEGKEAMEKMKEAMKKARGGK